MNKQIQQIWDEYDKDKNGKIEGKELDLFIKKICDCDDLKGME